MGLLMLLEQANIREEVRSLKLAFCLSKYYCHDVKETKSTSDKTVRWFYNCKRSSVNENNKNLSFVFPSDPLFFTLVECTIHVHEK